MIRHRARRAWAAGLALTLGVLSVLVPAGSPAALAADPATPGLTIVGDATYDVLPEEGRVAVKVVLTVANHLKDTATKRYFFRVGYLTVVPNTAGFKLTAPSGKPKVTVSSKTESYTNLRLDFGANLAAGKSTTLTLTYDIEDPGGSPDRPVRISRSLVSFSAWAVAAPGSAGSSVTVRFPAGYDVAVGRGPLSGPTIEASGHEVWTSGPLAEPLEFVADLSADRPTDYVEIRRTVELAGGGATIALQAWDDDPDWEERIGALIERALPVLQEAIGLPWPSDEPLQVREALIRNTGGYAGIYDPNEHRIDIAYAAPDAIVIHELAHAWLNGALVADRWIAEGFASHYAAITARTLGIDPLPVTPPDPDAAAIPLNAWGAATPDASDAEAWGYAASLRVADAIAARAGEDTLRAVWAQAAAGIGAYQPAPGAGGGAAGAGNGDLGAEPAAAAPDWRGLLDLVEGASGKDFSDLWRTWVARPDDVAILADRAVARGYYARTLALAGDWQLPRSIRAAMRAWRFDVARDELVAADAVLAQRATLETTAAAAGATLPGTLRDLFEGDAGLAAVADEARAEQAVVDAIAAARAARPTERGVGERFIIDVGLLFQDPDARVADAVAGLAAGRLQEAYAAATRAQDLWRSAADVGRSRILSVILILVALALLVGLLRRGATLPRHPAGTAAPSGARPADDEEGAATQA